MFGVAGRGAGDGPVGRADKFSMGFNLSSFGQTYRACLLSGFVAIKIQVTKWEYDQVLVVLPQSEWLVDWIAKDLH